MHQAEREICIYLKSMPGQFVSARDIARRAGGKWRYRDDPNWAESALARLLELKIIETDSTHHYRLIIKEDKKNAKKWVSPQMRRILENSGKNFTHVIDEEDLPKDFYEDRNRP
jgi:hypothetical protein